MGKNNGMEHKPKSRKETERKYDKKVCTVERVDIGNGNNIVNFVTDQEWETLIIQRKGKENAAILDQDVKDSMNKYVVLVESHMIINHNCVINY